MFFSEDEYKKYSLFGTFESELKRNEFNLNESKFEVLPFLNYCQSTKNETSSCFVVEFIFLFSFTFKMTQIGTTKWSKG